MSLQSKVYQIRGVVHLSHVLDFLGLETMEQKDDFTENISAVTWGDANYTLVDVHKFYTIFIQPSDMVSLTRGAWLNIMRQAGIAYINLEY